MVIKRTSAMEFNALILVAAKTARVFRRPTMDAVLNATGEKICT